MTLLATIAAFDRLRKTATFDESKHPRAANGEFGSGGGGAASHDPKAALTAIHQAYGHDVDSDFKRSGIAMTAAHVAGVVNAAVKAAGADLTPAQHAFVFKQTALNGGTSLDAQHAIRRATAAPGADKAATAEDVDDRVAEHAGPWGLPGYMAHLPDQTAGIDRYLAAWVGSSQSAAGAKLGAAANMLLGHDPERGLQRELVGDLRAGKVRLPSEAEMAEFRAEHARTAQAWDAAHPGGCDVHRGIGAAEVAHLDKLAVGDTAEALQPLISTSFSKAVAGAFPQRERKGRGNVVFEKVRGAQVFASHESSPDAFESHAEQQEAVLFTQGWTFAGKSTDKTGKTTFRFRATEPKLE